MTLGVDDTVPALCKAWPCLSDSAPGKELLPLTANQGQQCPLCRLGQVVEHLGATQAGIGSLGGKQASLRHIRRGK